jgi:alcohol dehydrogenase class IV
VGGDFVWEDAGRTVVFRAGALDQAADLIQGRDLVPFALLSTPRALAATPELAAAAASVHEVGPGQIPDLAAKLLPDVAEASLAMRGKAQPRVPAESPTLVALGGGRVIDTAKALASVTGAQVVAIPTTMSGAEMTAIHRLPAGAESRVLGMVRPRLVIADPGAMTSQPEPQLRASSMNALAHGADSLYTPFANPVSVMAALRGAELIAAALDQEPAARELADLALGSLLCGYAIDSAKFGLHHVICQTLVRVCGTPHAETNAAILPRAAAFLAAQAPADFTPLAAAIGTDLEGLEARLLSLGGNPPGLAALGAAEPELSMAIEAMLSRSELAYVPNPPSREDLDLLLAAASG